MNKKLLTLVALPFIALPAVACAPKHAADVQKAKQSASAADTQLKADGYDPIHVPGFGKVDLGFAPAKPFKYEVVYAFLPKHESLVRDAITEANKKPQPGVQLREVEDLLVVVDATNLKQLKGTVKSLVKAGGA